MWSLILRTTTDAARSPIFSFGARLAAAPSATRTNCLTSKKKRLMRLLLVRVMRFSGGSHSSQQRTDRDLPWPLQHRRRDWRCRVCRCGRVAAHEALRSIQARAADMSAWRLAARALYENGGSGTFADICDPSALQQLQHFGLATSTGTRGGPNKNVTWSLTQLGIYWCEGRVAAVCGPHPLDRALRDKTKRHASLDVYRPRGRATWFVATWLMSLPHGVRIKPGAES